jgi:hypothetical protein
MALNSKILLGLPNLPADTIDPKFYSEFLTIYRAIQNLLAGVSEFAGIDPPDAIEIASMDPTKYLQASNLAKWYPIADVAIVRGQLVRPTTVGSNHCTLAGAGTGLVNGPACGVANTSVAPGQKVEVIMGGLIDAIGGMTPGILYYLSTTLGAVQNLRPVSAGQIIQPIGWALSPSQMILNISSYAHII